MRRPNWQQTELSVGEVSARSGVAVSALRFYERQGLIRARAHLATSVATGEMRFAASH